MKQKDKDLLLRDLCSRLPYGVKFRYKYIDECFYKEYGTSTLKGVIPPYRIIHSTLVGDDYLKIEEDEVKPYLFPMSSMTEEQKKEYYSLADDVTIKPEQGCYLGIKIHCIKLGISDNPHEEVWDYINLDALDWLNKNHFDYRGLIEKGLAIDCSNLNIY